VAFSGAVAAGQDLSLRAGYCRGAARALAGFGNGGHYRPPVPQLARYAPYILIPGRASRTQTMIMGRFGRYLFRTTHDHDLSLPGG